MGVFVSRHLGLLFCNIAIMKRFLPLLILTGLLFGQDVLYLKSGEVYSGTFIGKVGKDIVFNVFVSSSVSSPNWMEGVRNKKKFPIWDVETIVTNNGELTYPFDIETIIEEDKSGFWKRAFEAFVTGNQDEFLRQNTRNTSPWACATVCIIILLISLNPPIT